MLFRVIWSEFAEIKFVEIQEYYLTNISEKIAKKIAKNILLATQQLEKTPYLGQKEELLLDRDIEYRYLVYTNYKIIYSVEEHISLVKIHDIFDTRQNPIKIKRNAG
jgi:plasmid stabilization system protein ParE